MNNQICGSCLKDMHPCHKNGHVIFPHVRRARGSFFMKTWPPDSNRVKNFKITGQKLALLGPRLGQIWPKIFFSSNFQTRDQNNAMIRISNFWMPNQPNFGPIWAFGPSLHVYGQIYPSFAFLWKNSRFLSADKIWKKLAQIWAKIWP